MADRNPKPDRKPTDGASWPARGVDPFSGLAGFAALNEQSIRSMSDAGLHWLKAVEALQREIVTFAGRRASEGAAHTEALLRCRNAQDVVQQQTEHIRHMMEDYLGEVQKLLTVWLEASAPAKTAAKDGAPDRNRS